MQDDIERDLEDEDSIKYVAEHLRVAAVYFSDFGLRELAQAWAEAHRSDYDDTEPTGD